MAFDAARSMEARIAVVEDRVATIKSEDLVEIRTALADLRLDVGHRLDVIAGKLDSARTRANVVMGSLMIAVLLFAADLAVRF